MDNIQPKLVGHETQSNAFFHLNRHASDRIKKNHNTTGCLPLEEHDPNQKQAIK